jgi:hypothetical protein
MSKRPRYDLSDGRENFLLLYAGEEVVMRNGDRVKVHGDSGLHSFPGEIVAGPNRGEKSTFALADVVRVIE